MPRPKITTGSARCDQPGSLFKNTVRLLKKDRRTLEEIEKETGLPISWLSKLRAQEFNSPNVNRVQFLWEKLSGKKL